MIAVTRKGRDMQQDVASQMRTGLKTRIEAIAAQRSTISLPRICEQIDLIRHDAKVCGLAPLERLASMLETALARHGIGPVVLSYLDLMRDACDCDDCSEEASTAWLAALSLRVGH